MVMYTSEPVVTERSVPWDRPADRLLAQRTLFAGPSPEAPDELYAVVVRGVMVCERSRVILDGHAAVHTNTFFGRFPASYWQRWTSVRSVEFGAVVSGSGLLRIMASDAEGDPRTVATHHVADGHSEPVQLTLPDRQVRRRWGDVAQQNDHRRR